MSEPEASHIEYWVMGFNHGINQERDRIIELIEKWWQEDETNHIGLIALIKEGNK